MKKIAVIGDSHASLYSDIGTRGRGVWSDQTLNNMFDVKWIGPVTYWRLCRDQKQFIDFDKDIIYAPSSCRMTTKCEEGQHILFVLGEIDVRCNILKHGADYKSTIDTMINQIKEFAVSYGDKFHFHFQSILPTIYRVNFGDKIPLFPFVGNDDERRDVTLYFNEKLNILCKEINAGYFDIFDIYADENNMMLLEKSDRIVHAMKTLELEEYIKEYFKDEQ